jgi:hypothetical protein
MKKEDLRRCFAAVISILVVGSLAVVAQDTKLPGSSNFTVGASRSKAVGTAKSGPAGSQLVGTFEYKYDDGTRESALSLSGSGELAWIHQYQAVGNNRQIVSILTSWEDVANGRPARMFVWRDPNQDGNPSDAVLVRQQAITVQNTNTGIVNEYVLSTPVDVSGKFFVGFAVQQLAGELPCPADTSSVYVAGRTWFVGDFQAFNPNNLAGNDVPPTDAGTIGTGYAILRASANPAAEVTYQGSIRQIGVPLNGNADLRFSLFDQAAAGAQVGSTVQLTNVAIANGIFTVQLPFSTAEFTGPSRWLEISVASPPGGTFTLLSPRQQVGVTPYALHAQTVDWASILNLPPGFADGIDDAGTGDITGVTAGSGLTGGGTSGGVTLSANFAGSGVATTVARSDHFHNSLDASDGSPTDSVFVDSLGNVGIGTLTPARRLHVANGVSGATSISTADMVIEDDGAAFQHFITPDDIESGFLFGDPAASIGGGIIFNSVGSNNGMLFRTGGNTTRMTLNGAGQLGIGVPAPTATLHVGGVAGDGSVILPTGAIGSVEMFDEPGIAADSEGVIAEALNTSVQSLLSRSIDVPSAGFVLVIGSAQATANHVNGTQSMANFGVSTSATAFPSNQDVQVSLPASAAAGGYNWAVSVHHVFTVAAAGSQTFHLLGQAPSANWSASETQLTLVFFATDYGVVSFSDMASGRSTGNPTASALNGPARREPEPKIELEPDKLKRLQEMILAQNDMINKLKSLVCKNNANAEVCK